MSDTATSSKTFAVGDKIADRYEVAQVLPAHRRRLEYQAKDLQDHGSLVILTLIGKPTKETEPDKIKRGLERASRVASWIRTPGAVIPRDFLCEQGTLLSVSVPPTGSTVSAYIQEHKPALSVLVSWLTQLASVLEVFHDARQPQFLGRIPIDNLQVTSEGQIQLIGFDMGPDFK